MAVSSSHTPGTSIYLCYTFKNRFCLIMAFLMCGCLIGTAVNILQPLAKKTNRLLISHTRNMGNAQCISHFFPKNRSILYCQ